MSTASFQRLDSEPDSNGSLRIMIESWVICLFDMQLSMPMTKSLSRFPKFEGRACTYKPVLQDSGLRAPAHPGHPRESLRYFGGRHGTALESPPYLSEDLGSLSVVADWLPRSL